MKIHNRTLFRRKKHRLWLTIELFAIIAWIGIATLLIHRFAAQRRIADEERAAEIAHESIITGEAIIRAPMPASTFTPTPSIQPEIQELIARNEDAVGLLHFEGDRTLYVCRSGDNAYYMTHRFDGSEDPAGMIYMDFRDTLWPRSDNIILYGHNMRDGSRFGTLRRFERKDYLMQYPIFQLVDLYDAVDYVPFAIFHTSAAPEDSQYFAFDKVTFESDEEFDAYIDEVKSRSVLDIPLEVTPGDRLLTLATCHSSLEHGRLVIVCREVKEGENFEEK